MDACLKIAVCIGVGIMLWVWWRNSRPRKSNSIYRPPTRTPGAYQSPLGLVEDPEDEWIEYAIMDDLLDGDG